MEIYKGIPYFQESPYQKLSPEKQYTATPSIKKEMKFRMRAYNYSKTNAMFVKPVKQEELHNVTKTSIICTKFKQGHPETYRSFEPDENSNFRETLGHLRSSDTYRSRSKGVVYAKSSQGQP